MEFKNVWVGRRGKGVKQTQQRDSESGELLFQTLKDKETGEVTNAPVMGNEQFEARQVAPASIKDVNSVEGLIDEFLPAVDGSVADLKAVLISGLNSLLIQKASGVDPFILAARKVFSLDLPNYAGMSVEQIADYLRSKA